MSDRSPDLRFLLGKGGVGKSTFSALLALDKSKAGLNTLLVSMDPAHNQADIFQQPLSEKPTAPSPNLRILQVNLEKHIKNYLKESENNIKQRYNYLTAFNIQDHFKTLQYSPGIEEYAMLRAYGTLLKTYPGCDVIIFDMPPTAMALRFFSLPQISLSWIEELIKLREKILKKQQIVSNIRMGKKKIETDPVLTRLKEMQKEYDSISQRFESPSLGILLVTRPDDLSLAESQRIHKKMNELNLSIDQVILNGSMDEKWLVKVSHHIPANDHIGMPQSKDPLIGMNNLTGYLSANAQQFKKI